MYTPKKKLNEMFSEREIKILQKAKAYEVDILCNELLAKELFSLTFGVDLDKQSTKELLKFYEHCDNAIEVAQMSS